jgi:hypothetical protein
MRHGRVLALIVSFVAMAAPAHAQEPAPDRPPLEELRRRVRERFAERVQEELKLTPDQVGRLRTTLGDYSSRRREMQARQRALREALAWQLRPGIAAVPDSVARLTDELMTVRVNYAESFRSEQREMAQYLDPVQRAKITLLRDRLLNRAQEFRRRRPFVDR